MTPPLVPFSPRLRHVATLTVSPNLDTYRVRAGTGTMVVVDLDDVRIEGEVNASMVGKAAADWLSVHPDRTSGHIDVRQTLQTDDGVLLYLSYVGTIDFTTRHAVMTPTFMTDDDAYRWLETTPMIGVGVSDVDTGKIVFALHAVDIEQDQA